MRARSLSNTCGAKSWTLPAAIILIVPMCLLAAISGVLLRGMDNNIFTQIGLVVLVGLACKNAILIIEYAKQQMDAGVERHEAAVEACRLRLRPILMTSFAFSMGVWPLVIALGAGSEMRQALGTAVFSGMLGVTFSQFSYPKVPKLCQGGDRAPSHDRPQSVPSVRRYDAASQRA